MQETRMNAIAAYEAAKGAKERLEALMDVLVLCAFSLLPPDRGEIRWYVGNPFTDLNASL